MPKKLVLTELIYVPNWGRGGNPSWDVEIDKGTYSVPK